MIFQCPNCGYKNELNSTGKCEACPDFIIHEMQDFLELDKYLDELLSQSSIELTPRLIHIYFSDLENTKFNQVKKKFQLEDLIKNTRASFYSTINTYQLSKINKDIINALVKYDPKMPKIIELFDDKGFYLILNAKKDYWDYDNYLKIIKIYAKKLSLKTGLSNIEFFFPTRPQQKDTFSLGSSAGICTIDLNKDFLEKIYNDEMTVLYLIFVIIHELVHTKITYELKMGLQNHNLKYLMEYCISRACRSLAEKYGYQDIYKKDNYKINYEEITANKNADTFVRELIKTLKDLVSEEDITKYSNETREAMFQAQMNYYSIDFKTGSIIYTDNFPFEKLPNSQNFFVKRNQNSPEEAMRNHELLDILIENNNQILKQPNFQLLNTIYLNENGTVRRKNISELESDYHNTNNPYLQDYLEMQINYLRSQEKPPKR